MGFLHLKRTLATGLAAVALASGLTVQAQAATAAGVPVDKTCGTPAVPGGGNCMTSLISAGFDMIKGFRNAANNNKLDNAQFTQNTATELSKKFPGFNVLVFKTVGTDLYETEWFKNEYKEDMKGVLIDTTFKLNHFMDKEQKDPSGYDKFRIWVFQGDSTFRNRGDGGFMNWAFIGQDSDTVKKEPWTCRMGTARPYKCDGDVRTLHFPARAGVGSRTGSLTPDSAAPAGYHACLDVSGNSAANGTSVQMWECNGGDAQRWTYNGYKLRAANGKCLDLADNRAANGTKLQVWDCLEIPGQRWYMSPSGGFRHLTDLNDRSQDVCIDDFSGATANGSAVTAWACGSEDRRDAPNQNWAWGGTPPTTNPTTPPGNGADVILKLDNGLGAVPVGGAAGSAVVPGLRGGNESKWKLTSVGGGRYRITSAYGLELTESGGYMAELQPWSNSSKQKWELNPVSTGRYQIRISSDDCLAHSSDFKQLGVWTCERGWKQEWVLESANGGGVIVPGGGGGGGGGGGSSIPTERPMFIRLDNGLGATAPNETASWGAPVLGGIVGAKGSTWTVKSLGGDRYRIVNDLGYNLTENPDTYLAEQQAWGDTSNQKWQFKSVGNGKYQIQISDDDCLTHDSDHKQLGVWTCEGGWKQEWSLQLR